MFFRWLCFSSVLYLAAATSIVGGEMLVLPLGVAREFACASPPGTDYVIVWLVNGTSAAHSEFQDYIDVGEEVHLDSGVLQRNLTFTAEIRTNNTCIQCDIFPFGGKQYTSMYVNIILQDKLSLPPVDMTRNPHSVRLIWSAPFTLNISDMEPDILHYVVYIIRDDGHNDTVNTTDTHYELQADPCQSHQYHVEIAAVNVVGEGEKYRSPKLTLEGYAVANVSDTKVSFRNKILVVKITVEVSSHCHDVGMVNYEVKLNATYSDDKLSFNSSGSMGKHTVHLTSPAISMNELYDCIIRIEGVSNSESTRMGLSTFDVQHVSTAVHDQNSGCIDVTCYFVEESTADGCRVVAETLQEYSNATFEFVALKQDGHNATVTVTLPNGIYTILVYDYEAGAVYNPAFTTTLTVQGPRQVSECATVLNDSASEINVILPIILISSSILMAVIASLVTSVWFCKHKGRKYVHSDIEQNDYCDPSSYSSNVQLQPGMSVSSEPSSSSETTSGSDSLDQSTGSNIRPYPVPIPASGQTHYADLDVTKKHVMARPPPTSNDESVDYAALQLQDTAAHSNQSQGNMNGQLSGPHATDDNN